MAARDKHGSGPPHGGAFSVIGQPARKADGLAKATGEALYADDLALPGMLHAKTLRSTVPHARLKRLDASKARALPGVLAVITGADLPEKYGVIPWTQDETALAADKVRFIGDAVAAVAAVDEDTAIDALEPGRRAKEDGDADGGAAQAQPPRGGSAGRRVGAHGTPYELSKSSTDRAIASSRARQNSA